MTFEKKTNFRNVEKKELVKMADIPNYPYAQHHSLKNFHFPKTSFIASLRDDYYKLRIKYQNLFQLSLSEYKAIKDTLTHSEHRTYKRYHKLLNQLICEKTKTAKELDETLKNYLSLYSFG